MAEVLTNLKSENNESRRRAKFDSIKFNLTESVIIEQVKKEIVDKQEKFEELLNTYEYRVRKYLVKKL